MIAAIGEKRDEYRQSLESGPGVAEVVPILAPYKVASREVKAESTVVRVGSLMVGNAHVGMIAGPCSVENEEQTLSTARAVKAAGATALRGGALQAPHQSLQLPGPQGRRPEDPGRRPRRDRPARGDRGHVGERRETRGPLCRRLADRRPQHAELSSVGGRGGRGQAGAVEARAQRHARRITCWRPSMCSTPAIPM